MLTLIFIALQFYPSDWQESNSGAKPLSRSDSELPASNIRLELLGILPMHLPGLLDRTSHSKSFCGLLKFSSETQSRSG